MAAKRFFDDSGTNPDQPNGKRLKNKPSLASVIGEVVVVNFLQNFCKTLEPMLRKVVREEVEYGLRECSGSFTRSPSFQIQSLEPSNLQLTFSKGLSLPLFTGSKIVDIDNSPLQIVLVDTTNDQLIPTRLSSPLKIEIVVLDGDFPPGGRETWTSEEFNRNVVKERAGKRPLLAGELQVTMRDGVAPVGEIEFTDNSSWIRSRKFRIGARVVVQGGGGQGVRVREAMTKAFVVKDHRGELYKKHHPPMLDDEVWRLEKIGKEGAFHKKLASMGVTTVQEFLKLSVVEPSKLKKILGVGMSEKMWEVTLKHARSCVLGSKLYISRGPNYFLILNPICQVVKAVINGQTYPTRDLPTMNRAYVENLVREAYRNWNSLEEVDGVLNEVPLLTQGDVEEYPNHQQSMARQHQQHDFLTGGSNEVNYVPNSANMESNDWLLNSSSTYFGSSSETGVRYNLSETSSDGELTPVTSFIHED